jgi:hypothetical protein
MFESLISRLTGTLALSGGMDESVTVTEIGYFPAVAGLPVSCPLGLNARPGGREPVSVQLRGGEPPEARNV